MSLNYREDYHTKDPSSTRRPRDVRWRSPEGPNVWDLQGIFMGLSGDKYKNWWSFEKIVFQK